MVGNAAHEKRKEFATHYLCNTLFAGSQHPSNLPLLKQKQASGKTLVYVCENKTFKHPVEDTREAIKQMVR